MVNYCLIGSESDGSNQGIEICYSDGMLFIGGPTYNNDVGAVWIYCLLNGRWTEVNRITHPNTKLFGSSITVIDEFVYVASPGEGKNGVIHIFDCDRSCDYVETSGILVVGGSCDSNHTGVVHIYN
jgi:hypothetical protein